MLGTRLHSLHFALKKTLASAPPGTVVSSDGADCLLLTLRPEDIGGRCVDCGFNARVRISLPSFSRLKNPWPVLHGCLGSFTHRAGTADEFRSEGRTALQSFLKGECLLAAFIHFPLLTVLYLPMPPFAPTFNDADDDEQRDIVNRLKRRISELEVQQKKDRSQSNVASQV